MVDASAAAGAAKWIGSALIDEAKYLYGVEDQLRSLQRSMEYMHELLQEVDAKPHLARQDGQLRNLIKEMRELAFRAEDAIDTYIVAVATKIDKKNFLLKLACLTSHSYPVHLLINEIVAIQQDLQNAQNTFQNFRGILQQNTSQQQQGNHTTTGPSSSRAPNPEHYIHLDEVVVGIGDVITQLVRRLTDRHDDFKVVGIVGTGGAGKTTLATQIYRHREVASRYSSRAFVSLSQEWSRTDLLHRIFKQVKEGEDIPSTERELVDQLFHYLNDNKCLIVLDDIWHKEAWDAISPIIPPDVTSCRVILTTRKEDIPRHASNKCIIHEPKLLTDEEMWTLFSKVAMEGRQHIENNIVEFERLGRQMLGKCGGLPLAVVTLAGVLKTKQELAQWEGVNKAVADYILKGDGVPGHGVVENMMELSYFDLPTYLKPCFLYLTIFPEDREIEARMLIWMWIAEGLIRDDMLKGDEEIEDAGMRFLFEMANRCILRVMSRNALGEIISFHLHDLMREFCIQKAKEHHFLRVVSSANPDITGARRIANFSREHFPEENHHLRTLFYHVMSEDLPQEVIRSYMSINDKFKLLRVLHIRAITNSGLPEKLGSFIHLRYLRIFLKNIDKLPNSIRNLQNLLYLYLEEYFDASAYILEVPNNLVGNMQNLRALVVRICLKRRSGFNRLGLRGSKNLHTLECGAGKWMAKELPTLSPTIRNLSIYDNEEMDEIGAIYQCPGITEDRLSTFKWCLGWRVQRVLEFDLQKLTHCRRLRHLELDCSLSNNGRGTNPFPPNLVTLILTYSQIAEGDGLIQALGELSQLKSLYLSNKSYLGTQLEWTAGAFPQLRELRLWRLDDLEEWRMAEGAMPRLSKIQICDCKSLKGLPKSIKSITTLKELDATRMSHGFRSALWFEDSDIIQHIASVSVTSEY